jgi:signal transduction histidine kinase
MRSRGLRGRLILAVLGVVAVGLILLVAGFNLVLRSQLDNDINAVLRARAAAQVGALETVDGKLAVLDAPDEATAESQVWIFGAATLLEHPRKAHPRVDAAAAGLAGAPRRFVDLSEPADRLLAQPVHRGGRRIGTVVVAVSRTPYERTEQTALVASILLGAVLIIALALVARWMLDAALRPVARMTSDAEDWSEHDLDRRFALGPPTDELTRLAATLDGLLDRLAAGMRREQRLSSELSHELRTPLAKISTEAQLLASSPDLPSSLRPEAEGIVRSAGQMREVIEVLMASARAQAESKGEGTADVESAARATLDAAGPAAAERGVAFELISGNGASAARATAEPKLVERILAPLVENAGRHARSRATVRIARRGQWLEVTVEDDGPGVEAGEEATIFEPGVRGEASRATQDRGAGLGLSLARRLARSAGGDVEADAGADGGRFVVRLPAA